MGDAACVDLSDTDEQVNLLVVEPGKRRALSACTTGVVIAGRTMQLGDAIKIMNDRLKPQVIADSFSLEQAVLTLQPDCRFGNATAAQNRPVITNR